MRTFINETWRYEARVVRWTSKTREKETSFLPNRKKLLMGKQITFDTDFTCRF